MLAAGFGFQRLLLGVIQRIRLSLTTSFDVSVSDFYGYLRENLRFEGDDGSASEKMSQTESHISPVGDA
jgi:hypothetical protein